MSPREHESMLKDFYLAAFLIVIMGIFIKFIEGSEISSTLIFMCGSIIGIPIMGLILIYLIPVRCKKPECRQRMQPDWYEEEAPNKLRWRMVFRCNGCDDIYIYNFTVSVGLGEPW